MPDVTIGTVYSVSVTDTSVNSSGKLVAASAEDGTIRIFSINSACHIEGSNDYDSEGELLGVLTGHTGSVVTVAWAPPQHYVSAFLSCGEDGQVILWSDANNDSREWMKVYTTMIPSVPCCAAWAPPAYGKMFAVGCKSGAVVVFTGDGQQWDRSEFSAHSSGCFSLSWGPSIPPGALFLSSLEINEQKRQTQQQLVQPVDSPRVVTCGGEHHVVVWTRCVEGWKSQELPVEVKASWREVAWAPGVGTHYTHIAAGSEEGFVVVWSHDGTVSGEWTQALLPQQEDSVTRLSWSPVGSYLLVSCANGTASMWQESMGSYGWERCCELSSVV